MRFDVIEVHPKDPLPAVAAGAGVDPISRDEREQHAPDRHLIVCNEGTLLGRCSCWWTSTPSLEGRRVGAIGHYATGDDDAAAEMLARACDILAEAGCATAVGPMDGNTWRRYRFVVDRGAEPPFFLEPDNPGGWPRQWTDAGFTPRATYSSSLNDDLSREDPRTPEALQRLERAGISIRAFNPRRARSDLHRVFALSLTAFQRNFLYAPLAENEFLAQNRALLPSVRPELMLLAERGRQLVGFVFAIPDLLQAQRGEAVDTAIIKTAAVDPGVAGIGLGGVLVDRVQQAARALGFRRAIHALMHDANVSRALSNRHATPIRRYALFSRPLARR